MYAWNTGDTITRYKRRGPRRRSPYMSSVGRSFGGGSSCDEARASKRKSECSASELPSWKPDSSSTSSGANLPLHFPNTNVTRSRATTDRTSLGVFAACESGALGLRKRINCVVWWLLLCFTVAMAAPCAEGSVILYTYPLAFNPAKAKLALEEKNIRYTEKKIDLFSGQSLEPWFLKLNPNASAPTLVTPSQTITESMEIVKWADNQGTPLGGNSVDRAFVNSWLEKVDKWDGNLFVAANSGAGGAVKFGTKHKIKVAEANRKRNPDMAELYTQKIAGLEKIIADMSDTALIESNRKQIKELIDEAETILATKKFLAGDEYSVADVIFMPVIYRMYTAKQEKVYVDPNPNLKRYYEELKRRPSYKKVFCVSDSGLASVAAILPALAKVLLSKATGKY